jgi:glycosyltransferase involved in cell wall biosynthesis
MNPALSIIVPAYNEAARLGQSLHTILEYLSGYQGGAELIVVDDGSADETARVAEAALACAARAVKTQLISVRPNRGKGHAVREGLLAASASIALFTDADLSTPITETPKLVAPIERGEADLTFGSRALDRSLIGVHQPWRREQGGKVFNLIVRLSTGLPFWDTQCGFKAFRMSACRPIVEAATIDRFGFDVELIYVAHLARLSLKEIPVRWDHYEGSKVNVTRDSRLMFNEVRLIRRQARDGYYQQAIASSREAARQKEMIAVDKSESGAGAASDVSPELADAARRI